MVVATARLLVLNPQAGNLTAEDEAKLREALSDFEVLRLEEGQEIGALLARQNLTPDATIAVAGGDGTVSAAARALAGTERRLGIIPLGTFNNFARALGVPLEAEAAARALATGRHAEVALGRINGRPFLEAVSLGLFGDLLNLGEALKELRYGELLERVRELTATKFSYRLDGDLRSTGEARAIVAANTPSTGALVPVGSVTPEDSILELTFIGSAGRGRMLRRLAAQVLPFVRPPAPGARVRHIRVETDPPVNVYADADQVGQTPAEIEVEAGALHVILPR